MSLSCSSTFQELRSRRGLPPLNVAIPRASHYHSKPDLSPDAQQAFNVSQALEAIARCLDRIDQA